MGCLNSGQGFRHVFGNVHLSGPCNRRCYFCIGQHMMSLDKLNTLDVWPLPGWSEFLERCRARKVSTVYLTGTNTDPLLYRHTDKLVDALHGAGFRAGVRTNGAAHLELLERFDTGSVTICSLSQAVHTAMMGRGTPADVAAVINYARRWQPGVKVNVVLGPENGHGDLFYTLDGLLQCGVRRVNLREPYGQPHVGDILHAAMLQGAEEITRSGTALGMPVYRWRNALEVLYWDVHYVHVESVNLYANGRVSDDYPITRGHDDNGRVLSQDQFKHGRHVEQWT